jgi:hypothetical protein
MYRVKVKRGERDKNRRIQGRISETDRGTAGGRDIGRDEVQHRGKTEGEVEQSV